jgi:hypothetical protein
MPLRAGPLHWLVEKAAPDLSGIGDLIGGVLGGFTKSIGS